MTAPSITVAQMRPKLLTLDYARNVLAMTEPLSTRHFTVGDEVRFTVDRGWQHGLDPRPGTDRVGASVIVGKGSNTEEFQLTKDALLTAAAKTGLNRSMAAKQPAELLEPHLNFWWREGMMDKAPGQRDFQLLVAGGAASAFTRASVNPFSNVRLVDEALTAISDRWGSDEVLVDYKFHHSLRRTHLRLILPNQGRRITGTGTDDDVWSVGLQIKNSLIAEEPTSIDGYLFRWWCTNGQIDCRAATGAFTRRGQGQEHNVYEWARQSVDQVLGGLEPALDAVQATVDIPIAGQADEVLRDVFTHYRVPVAERTRIIDNMLNEQGSLTMYSVMAAITQVANDSTLATAQVESLMRMGGDLPHAATSRCDACRRLMPH